MEIHARAPGVRRIAMHDLRRYDAIASDLCAIAGDDWETTIPLLPSAGVYILRIATHAQRFPGTLVAHAYVRYLGDLSGGQVLKRLLAETLGLGPDALTFYDFGAEADTAQQTASYLAAIDAAGRDFGPRTEKVVGELVEEAAEAFRCNIAVSEAVFEALNAAG
jgi:heme oxygenase